MTLEAGDVGGALAELAALAGETDLAGDAEAVRRGLPRPLALVAAEGADASLLAAWIARNAPDVPTRIVDRLVPADGLGRLALVLRADRLVDAEVQDRFAEMSLLAPPGGLAVVALGVRAGDEAALDRLGRGLARAFLPAVNVGAADLAAHRVFLFEEGGAAPSPLLDAALAAFVAWLRVPVPVDDAHRAALGLRLLATLEAAREKEPASEPALSGEGLRALGARVVRQFESEFETTAESIEAGLRKLEADVASVLRHGQAGSADRETPVDVRVDLWEARTREAILATLNRTRGYAEGLLRDVPWDALEAHARRVGAPGDFRRRLVAAWREVDEAPLPHMGDAIRAGLGDASAAPQAPVAIQAGLGMVFGGVAFYLMFGPVMAVAGAIGTAAGVVGASRGARHAAEELAPVFATARTRFAENAVAYLAAVRDRTAAILDEAARAAETPAQDAVDPIPALRDRLARAVAASSVLP